MHIRILRCFANGVVVNQVLTILSLGDCSGPELVDQRRILRCKFGSLSSRKRGLWICADARANCRARRGIFGQQIAFVRHAKRRTRRSQRGSFLSSQLGQTTGTGSSNNGFPHQRARLIHRGIHMVAHPPGKRRSYQPGPYCAAPPQLLQIIRQI